MKLLKLNFGLIVAYVHDERINQVCRDVHGHHGQFNRCPQEDVSAYHPFTYMVGSCASGRNEDCKGWSHEFHCCNKHRVREPSVTRCENFYGKNYGEHVSCTKEDHIVFGACTGGKYQDCEIPAFSKEDSHELQDQEVKHNKCSHYITCCQSGLTIDHKKCYWRAGGYGIKVKCNEDDVVTGFCAGGKWDDCRINGKSYNHGIYCCPVID